MSAGTRQPPKSTVADPIAAAEQRGFERGRQWAIDALRDGEPYEEWRIAGGRTPYSPMSAAHFASYLEALATQPTDSTEEPNR